MIRPFGLRDVSALKQLQPRGVAFDLRRVLLSSISPTRSALLGYLTAHHWGAITCVHDNTENGDKGIVQVWPRRDRKAWDLAFLAPSLDEDPNAPGIWQKLLTHLILLGAEQGVLRIYARSSEDAEAEDILRQTGFSMVTREEVFVLSHQPAPAPLPRGLRRVEVEDRWALDKFHSQVIPPLMKKAEDPSFDICAVSSDPFRLRDVQEYVWSKKGEIIAWLRLASSPQGHWLDVVVRPEYRAESLPYIRYMLTLANVSKQTPLYCSIPDYCVGLGWLLRTLGFSTFTRQALLVAHTIARVPVRRHLVLPALERSIDVGPSVAPVHPDGGKTGAKLTA